jgi:hypothetical protein
MVYTTKGDLIMATHFKGPILYSAGQKQFENLSVSHWPDQAKWMDDFEDGAVDETNRWTIVKDSGAAVAIVADAANGHATLTSTATTDNDGASIQAKQECFSLPATAGDKLWWEGRLKVSDADQMDLLVGFTETFATNPENALASSNIAGFLLTDGNGYITGVTEKADSASVITFDNTTLSTLADDTFVTLGFILTKGSATAGDEIEWFINRQKVGASNTSIPTANMKLMCMSLSGDASGTKVTTIDYFMAAMDRETDY